MGHRSVDRDDQIGEREHGSSIVEVAQLRAHRGDCGKPRSVSASLTVELALEADEGNLIQAEQRRRGRASDQRTVAIVGVRGAT